MLNNIKDKLTKLIINTLLFISHDLVYLSILTAIFIILYKLGVLSMVEVVILVLLFVTTDDPFLYLIRAIAALLCVKNVKELDNGKQIEYSERVKEETYNALKFFAVMFIVVLLLFIMLYSVFGISIFHYLLIAILTYIGYVNLVDGYGNVSLVTRVIDTYINIEQYLNK